MTDRSNLTIALNPQDSARLNALTKRWELKRSDVIRMLLRSADSNRVPAPTIHHTAEIHTIA